MAGGCSSAAPLDAAAADAALSLLEGHERVLLAVSGGPDSTALMGLAAEWAACDAARPKLAVAVVDHGLRPESAVEAQTVLAAADRLGLPARGLRWQGGRAGSGVQARARAARYALLADEARRIGAGAIATAHTEDDQAETVLMRLAHGSGPAGLAGMRPEAVLGEGLVLLRPLLGIAKARLVATCAARGWAFATDPSNTDPRFERARWRRAAAPLAAAGLTQGRLARLAARMARQEAALERLAEAAFTGALIAAGGGSVAFRAAGLDLGDEIGHRVLARALLASGAPSPIPLERLEQAAARLAAALAEGRRLRLSLAGRVITLSRDGTAEIVPEAPRRRGRPAPKRRGAAIEAAEAGAASLGNGATQP